MGIVSFTEPDKFMPGKLRRTVSFLFGQKIAGQEVVVGRALWVTARRGTQPARHSLPQRASPRSMF